MITLSLPLILDKTDLEFIKNLQRMQSSVIRAAYKAASKGMAEKEVRASVTENIKGQIDSWFIQSAVKKGMGDYKSDKSQGRKSRIYGGRKHFRDRSAGKITKEEWKERRLQHLYIIGQASQKGNRKFEFHEDKIIFKPYFGKKIEIRLPVIKKNWSLLWKQAVLMASVNLIPITVSISQTMIYLTFDDEKVRKEVKTKPKTIKTRYAGIDMNPNYIGISIFDGGRLVETKLFSLKSMTGQHKINHDKLEFETIEVTHHIGRWLQHMQVHHLFIENLKFNTGDSGFGKHFNRLTKNHWKRNKFKDILGKYFKFSEISPAYTSVIGNVLYPSYPDPVAASMEVARRGYEIFVLKSKKFYPDVPCQTYLSTLWKNEIVPDVHTWKELADFLKKTGLKYRVPLPSVESFRIFQSSKSLLLFI